MIFLSHTHSDKAFVEPIAKQLATVFGQDRVFYDSWAIQPGDGIIDKMNEALSRCRFFFFFVSKKSLLSNMVKLEWQNAVLKATKGETRIIPVKLDDCMMPAVLLQTLYVDFYGQGPENALRQMIDVISGKNTYRGEAVTGFENVRGYVRRQASKIQIEFRAEVYMEPHSRYLVLVDNIQGEFNWKAIGELAFESGFKPGLALSDGSTVNALLVARSTPTTPGFPFLVELTPRGEKAVKLRGLMRAVSRDRFNGIPMIET